MTDRLMAWLETAVAGYAGIASRLRTRDVVAVDRELRLTVTRAELEAADVMGLTLADPGGGLLPEWTPGAHLDVVLPSGLLRQYSLCGDPDDRTEYRIAVRRLDSGGGGSVEIHGLQAGAQIVTRGPRNAFPFAYPFFARRDIRKVAFIAGGIGITALLPMIRTAAALGIDWSLTYVGRDESTMPFLAELRESPVDRLRLRYGVPAVSDVLANVDAQTSVYFCGPPSFLDDVRDALDTHPHAGFHFERFSAPPVVGGQPFAVRFGRSGGGVDVPADASALAAIRSVLPDVPYSCQQGFCGTCRVDVLEGTVGRRGTSQFLDRSDSMLLCVDRADSDITIDL
ncbi:PDR/VanB family oxidoreductase [Mycobacterium colombiense]|nr:PDR/VanB family oxidoreductase [Mycobacterium colombiense]